MKLNNYSNEIRTLVLYGENSEMQKEINPYNVKAFYDSENLFKEKIVGWDDYFKIIIENLIECNNNPTHINAKKKSDNIFVVWVRGKYGNVNGVLYIPFNKVIMHEVIEEKKDMRGDGCFNVSYNDKIVFDSDIRIICKDSEIYFAKPTDQVKSQTEEIKDIEECIQKEKEHINLLRDGEFKNRAQRLLKLYEQKKSEGYKYKVFNYRAIETNYKYLILYNCVDHYEKTSAYIKAEKLTEKLKQINKQWDIDDTIKLLKSYKLVKIRK